MGQTCFEYLCDLYAMKGDAKVEFADFVFGSKEVARGRLPGPKTTDTWPDRTPS